MQVEYFLISLIMNDLKNSCSILFVIIPYDRRLILHFVYAQKVNPY